MMRLSEANVVVHGRLHGADTAFSAVSIDTRTLHPGDLYVAILGNRFDGNDFLSQAEEAGAAAAMVGREIEGALPRIVVADTRHALAELAGEWRRRCGIPVIGVTGSNGKTTVKEMIAAILGVKQPVLATRGNLNNDIGVPLTLLGIGPEHRIAVVEMGANHPGEIAFTARCAKPDIAIITNAGAAHMEGFGSLEGVARAKGELIEALADEGVAVLNADDRFFDLWKSLAGARRTLTFGFSEESDLRGSEVTFDVSPAGFRSDFLLTYREESHPMSLALAGRHNIANALAAAAASLAAGADIAQIRRGLAGLIAVSGRLQPVRGRRGEIILNDTYNANPASLKAALEVLLALGNEPWLVLGAFAELGEESAELHAEAGRVAREMGVVRLYATGQNAENAVEAFGPGAKFFTRQAELIKALDGDLYGRVALLVKGSRSQRMEKVVEALSAGREG